MKNWNQTRTMGVAARRAALAITASLAVSTLGSAQDAALSAAIDRALSEEHFDAVWQVGTPFPDVEAGWQAPNKPENLRTFFLEEGVRIVPRIGGVAEWTLSLSLRELRRGDEVQVIPEGQVVEGPERVEVRREGIVEWYKNDARGLEQGFDLEERIGGQDQPLELLLDVGGDLELAEVLPQEVDFAEREGGGGLSMSGLFAFDSSGRDLPVSFERRGEELAIVVDDRSAVYPITIDPLLQNESLPLTVTGTSIDIDFGQSLVVEGTRALVGAPRGNMAFSFVQVGGAWELESKFVSLSAGSNSDFGESVALTGDRVLIGAPRQDVGNLVSAGRVHAYQHNGNFFASQGSFTAPVPEFEGHFGFSLAADGPWLAVGAPRHDTPSTNSGAVFIYRPGGFGWTLAQDVVPASFAGDDELGRCLAMHDKSLLIGAPGGFADAGVVFHYQMVDPLGNNPWVFEQAMTSDTSVLGESVAMDGNFAITGVPSDANDVGSVILWERLDSDSLFLEAGTVSGSTAGESFGAAVDITATSSTGPRAVVGAPDGDGAVYFLRRVSSTAWTEVQAVAAPVDSAARFGDAVAIEGDLCLVGAPLAEVELGRAGLVFTLEQHGDWVFAEQWRGQDRNSHDRFGNAVAIEGDIALVGCSHDDDAAFDAGGAYVFEKEGLDWVLTGKLTAGFRATPFDRFGMSVAISGSLLLVGAPHGKHSDGTESGAAYIFGRELNGGWTSGFRVQPSDPVHDGQFGYSVAVDTTGMAIGAPNATGNGNERGAVYAYGKSVTGAFVLEEKLTSLLGQFNERLGHSVDIEGDLIVAGKPGFDGSGIEDMGQAVVYERVGTNWSLEATLVDPINEEDARFGTSVSLHEGHIAVGVPGGNFGSGRVVLLEETPNDWSLVAMLSAPFQGSAFGSSLDMGSERLLVGAPEADTVGPDAGAAYLFLPGPAGWQGTDITPIGNAPASELGFAVAMDEGTVLLGAPGHLLDVFGEGMAHVLELGEAQPFVDYGLGDGSEGPCPCGNESLVGSLEGCQNSTGVGARLTGQGSVSIAAGDLSFLATQLAPGQPSLLFMGTTQLGAAPFGDGLLATGGFLTRLQVKQAGATGSATFQGLNLGLSAVDAGTQRFFQVWYRDPAGGGACGNVFNLSAGVAVTFEQ